MRNFTIGSITKIPIRLNITLVVFLPLLAYLISRPEQLAAYATAVELVSPHAVDPDALASGQTPILLGITAAVGLFASVLVHELGHSWTARYFDVGITSITLWIFGGMAHMEELPEDWNVEFWIAIAGPITSLVLAGGFFAALQVVPASAPLVLYVVGLLAVLNVSLAVFNMLPAFPMDGGRVLRALLARRRPYASATRTAAAVGQGFAVVMAIVAVLSGALLLLLIAMFIYVAASAESRTTVVRDLLRGITVRDLLTDRGDAVDAGDSVQTLLERIVTERRNGYPVVDGTELVGLVTLAELRDVEPDERDSRRVSDVMRADPPTIGPDADAFEALMLISKERTDRIVVTENGQVYGTISQRDLMTALETTQGLGDISKTDLDADGYA
ncbi:site-2 protease family protein [Natranaeroarchaeum sulfidigenes]|uniref:Zinc metalloprotease n=1 Tax=Natranaeroarchaeum sulfidigenes TaxID=2784880 RepID=A0A897MTJ6_9EURY|nr:site-2 protease family protein [Natranaeroarchaeum sulfidigenes]QSG03358.1 Zn-dependent protease fused to CBS domain [Natranaeroarchaeum sulfidigenes]